MGWADETFWSKEDLQQNVAFTTPLQLSELSSGDRGQNSPVLLRYINFVPSQFVKVAPNLLCHFLSAEAIHRIVLAQCFHGPWSHLAFTSLNGNTTAIIGVAIQNNPGAVISLPKSGLEIQQRSPDSGKVAFPWISSHARNHRESQDLTLTHTHRLLC